MREYTEERSEGGTEGEMGYSLCKEVVVGPNSLDQFHESSVGQKHLTCILHTTQQHMYRYNFICGRRVLEELKHARVQYLHITYMCLYTTLMNGAESELNVLVTTCTICLSHEIAVNTDIIACGSVSHNACPTCMYIHRLTISCMSACSWENH